MSTFRSRSFWGSFIICALGAILSGISSYQLYEHERLLPRLSPITAVVQDSFVETQRNSEGDTTHYPRLTYQYVVDGVPYTSKRYYLHDYGACSFQQARRLIEQYPAGQTVTAFYDIANPKTAVLNTAPYPGLPNMKQGGIWIMNIAAMAGAFLLCISLFYNPSYPPE